MKSLQLNTIMLLSIFSVLFCADSRMKIAVLDLKAYDMPKEESIILSEVLRSELHKQKVFRVINREDMQEIMGEQMFQNSGLCDEKGCLVEIGNVLSVEKIISGSVGKIGSTYSLTIKQINIETSENDKIINYVKKCSKEVLFDLIRNAALELSGRSPELLNKSVEEINVKPDQVELDEDLILFYTFNEDGKDRSRYKNHSKISNGTFTNDKYNIPNNALKFNGKNTFVDCGNDPTLDMSRNTSFVINFKVDSLPKSFRNSCLLHKKDNFTISITSLGEIKLYLPSIGLKSENCYTFSNQIQTFENIIRESEWYNLTIVINHDHKFLKIYLNNSLISDFDIENAGKIKHNKTNLYIGKFTNESSNSFYGIIDDVRIYRRSINRSEIDRLYIIQEWKYERLFLDNNCALGSILRDDNMELNSEPLKGADRFNIANNAWYYNGDIVYWDSHLSDFDLHNPFSISFWFKQNEISPEGYRIIDKAMQGRSNGIILDNKGDKYPGQQLRWLPNFKPIYGQSKYSLNKWHHVVLTYDSIKSKIYFDNKLDGESDFTVKIDNNDLPFIFGASQSKDADPEKYFKGYIDDIMIYSKALKPKEIELLYHDKGWK